MTQVADRVALPIRVHDLLLGLAGRLDDDALTDARELLASAELDRSLELIAGCLVAGRIPLSPVERRDLDSMFAEANCDTTLIQQLKVDDGRARPPVHKFHPGLVDSPIGGAEAGVNEAVHRVLEVLPDVRALWCVWRTTPAGPVAGPVPNRIVLVEIGPRGFPPATAYRIEHALRRAGIRAAVEVLRDNSPLTEYHRQGMQQARRVSFDGAPDAAPAEPASEPPRTWAQQRDASREPSRDSSRDPGRDSTRDSTWKEEPHIAAAAAVVAAAAEEQPATSSWIPEVDQQSKEATGIMEPVVVDDIVVDDEPPARPDRPNFDKPGLRQKASDEKETKPSPSPSPSPVPAPAPTASVSSKDTFEDSDLNDQERDLLRQLQEELAKREQAEASSNKKLSWQTDKSGRHDADLKWSSPSTPRIINGVPPTAGGTAEPPRFPPGA